MIQRQQQQQQQEEEEGRARAPRANLVRTYGKCQVRRVCKWLSPTRDHLFSNSDSDSPSSRDSESSSDPSFVVTKPKRRGKVSSCCINAKVVKRSVGKRKNIQICKRKRSDLGRKGDSHQENHSPVFTEEQRHEDFIFAEDKENYIAPITRNKAKQMLQHTQKLKFVTCRRKLRNPKTVNQVKSIQPQIKNEVFLGSSTEFSESLIYFDKPHENNDWINSSSCLSFSKKLDGYPLQTSTPSCSTKLKIKAPPMCAISFNSSNNDEFKSKLKPFTMESIDRPNAVGAFCPRKHLPTEESENNLQSKKEIRTYGFAMESKSVSFMVSMENCQHSDPVLSHSTETQKIDLASVPPGASDVSKELFTDVTEVVENPCEDGSAERLNVKKLASNMLAKSGMSYTTYDDQVTELKMYQTKELSRKEFQSVVQLDCDLVHKYLQRKFFKENPQTKSRTAVSLADVVCEDNSSRDENELQFVDYLTSKKLILQKASKIRWARSLDWKDLQPLVLLNPFEIEWHLNQKKIFIRNHVKASLGDGASCDQRNENNFQEKYSENLKFHEVHTNRKNSVQELNTDGASGADSNCSELVIGSPHRRALSLESDSFLNGNGMSEEKNDVSDSTSSRCRRQNKNRHTGSMFQEDVDSVVFSVNQTNRIDNSLIGLNSVSDVQLHEEKKNLQSTVVNSSLFSSPLSSRNWSKFKAAHSVHKNHKAIITPLKTVCTMSYQHNQETPRSLPKEKDTDQNNFATSETNLEWRTVSSKTSITNRIRRTRVSRNSFLDSGSSLMLFLSNEQRVYRECQQDRPISFKECIPLSKFKKCDKIGEGVFGEVFRTINDNGEFMVFKIIPIEGAKYVNGEPQKKFEEILSEIIISKKLHQLSEEGENHTIGFISLHNVYCVKGSYPGELLKAWDNYNQTKTSENDRPDESKDEQLYMIFEFEFGGCDLESMNTKIPSIEVAKSVLHQITASLAVAEVALNFEHRDLHWGNVLIKRTALKQIEYCLAGTTYKIDTHGFLANIIDYTLSRVGTDGVLHFCDLSSETSFFCGQGDYQFDIYRKMREENFNKWSDYNPHSNVLWLHYLAEKMLNMKYKKRAKIALKTRKEKFEEFLNEALKYQSAEELLHSNFFFQ
uniref:Serine/threonine-protein kinase haspin n=1 Tax=Callorhinchus milii TaxID=7868 RepID=A0A4W3HUT3_CALMI|eukprot:gi/632943916/ref/XP_007887217.1/ PREDICTED: serine/threonine-protein kinase haspin [Callorhinchus milii]